MKRFYTRKDLAQMLECTSEQVRKNEAAWGIKGFRSDLSRRSVRYKAEVLEHLKKKGIL